MNFSPSGMNAFTECPRCFWLEKKHKLKWPRGAYPSLPNGMDAILKKHYDSYRREAAGHPPELVGQVPGKLFQDAKRLKEFRGFGFGRGGIQVQFKEALVTACLDDLLEFEDGTFGVIDYKTRGWAPKEGDTAKYYGTQADGYRWALEKGAGLKTAPEARFIYYWPKAISGYAEEAAISAFNVQVVTIQSDPARFEALISQAIICLSGPIPPHSPTCERCAYVEKREALDKQGNLV